MSAYALPERYHRISNDGLKMIAAVTMLIDHIAYALILNQILLPQSPIQKGTELYTLYIVYRVMRAIGRTAFPIYCFCLVEGFAYTKSRNKYALRLFLFALISEIPFNLAFYGDPLSHECLNVFFTLFFGLLAIWAIDTWKERGYLGYLAYLCAIALAVLAHFIHTDYGWQGVALIVLFYLLRPLRIPQVFFGSFTLFNEFPFVIPGFVLLLFYNSKRKVQGVRRYFFYVFYPAHLLLLYLAGIILHNRI